MSVKFDLFTVKKAKAKLFSLLVKGAVCPCCGKVAKANVYKLAPTMVQGLLELHMLDGDNDGWVHTPTACSKKMLDAHSFQKLRFWGLLVKKESSVPSTRGTGYWGVTVKGVRFLKGEIKLFTKVVVYNNKRTDWVGKKVSVQDCITDFDYKQDVLTS